MSHISVQEYGSGNKSVVVFPGWTHPLEKEPVFLDILAKKYRVLSIHLPGYCSTPNQKTFQPFTTLVKEIKTELDKSRVHDPIFIGFSLGCWMISEFDSAYPNTFKKVFIGCPTEAFAIPIWAKPLLSSKLTINLLRKSPRFMQFCANLAMRMVNNDSTSVFTADRITLLGAFDSLVALLTSKLTISRYLPTAIFIYGEKDSFYQGSLESSAKHLQLIKSAGHNCIRHHEFEVSKIIDAV